MPAQISVAVKRVVVSNYLDGIGRNENYRKARRIRRSLSASSINTVVSEFKVVVNRVGIEAAAEEYGVTELVTELREIAEFRRESKVELAEMLEGGRLAQKLRDHSVDAGKFDQFIDSVFKRAEKNQYTGAMVVDQCTELAGLEEKYGLEYTDLKEKYDQMGEELPELVEKVEKAQKEIPQIISKREELFKQRAVDEKGLQDYGRTKASLVSLGLQVDDLKSIEKFLVVVRKEKFEPKGVISKLNSIGDLGIKLQEVKKELDSLQGQLKDTKGQLDKANQELSKKLALQAEVKRLENSGLSAGQIEKIRNAIVNVSASHSISSSEGLQRFEKEILEGYDALLGLRPEVTRLEKKKQNLEVEIEEAREEFANEGKKVQAKLQRLDEQYSVRKKEIEAYSKLRSQGVSDEALLRLDCMLEESKLDPAVLEAELKSHSNLKNLEQKVRKDTEDLGKQKLTLSKDVEELKREKGELTETLASIKENETKAVESILERIHDKADGYLEEVAAETKKYEKRVGDTSRLEDELNVARLLTAVAFYPETAEKLPLDRAVMLLDASERMCTAKGINPPVSIEAGRTIGPTRMNLLDCMHLCRATLLGHLASRR